MNSGSQGQQGHPGQGQHPQGQPGPSQQNPQPRPVHLFKPEQMRQLPAIFNAEKAKWENGLRQLWAAIESNPETSKQHQEAKQKLVDFSRTVAAKMAAERQREAQARQLYQAQQAQNAQQGQQAALAQQAQNQQVAGGNSGDQGQQAQAKNPQGGPGNGGNPAQGPGTSSGPSQLHQTGGAPQGQQGLQRHQQIPTKIQEHLDSFVWTAPPNLPSSTPEGAKWLEDVKMKYAKGLLTMENGARQVRDIEEAKKRLKLTRALTENEEREFSQRTERARKMHDDAKSFVANVRDAQKRFRSQQEQAGAFASNGNGNGGPSNGAAGTQGAARPMMSMQQPSNPAAQNTQTVNAAIEQARNQQMGAGRPAMPQGQGQQSSQGPQTAPNAASQGNASQAQGSQQPQIKQEAGVPPQINTAVTQMQQANQPRPGQTNSPQSALPQSATAQQHPQSQLPRPLTHQAALQTAAQRHSSDNTQTPNVMGHSHTHPASAPQRDLPTAASHKFMIPKHLHERAVQPPQAVPMPQTRPTLSGGPSGISNGVLGQPSLQKGPEIQLDAEDKAILSQRELQKLVRQVTGGGENVSGGGLTTEVEESVLAVADNFVDQVLAAACKNAKERGSKVLEVRDIQLTLERGYNIRIPGYASDEIRTVRKIAPSSGWINKMSAVQAAKVTGGKGSD